MKRKAAPPPLSDTEEKPKAKEEKQKKEEEEEQEKADFARIDWGDFVVVETITFTDADETANLPPPTNLS